MRVFHGFDDEGMPICQSRAARRDEIARQMRHQRPQIVPGSDTAELEPVRSAVAEGAYALAQMGIACACAAPVAGGLVFYWMTHP